MTVTPSTRSEPSAGARHNMQQIMALRNRYQDKLRSHAFFEWLRSPKVPLEKKLEFVPAMAPFVMQFRDMNLWVIRFPKADDVFKDTINGSTTEDETHSRLYLEDWRKLHFDDRLGWQASDVLWWLFLAEEMEDFRRFGVEFMRLCVEDGDDPLVRFAHSEAGEACGHVFFENMAPLAKRLGDERGLTYRYFGPFHLALETGHVLESEDIFDRQPLTSAQFDEGMRLAEHMFVIFDGIHDNFLNYVTKYVERGAMPRKNGAVRYTDETNTLSSVDSTPSAHFDAIHTTQQRLEDHLQTRKRSAEKHLFYQWLRGSDLPAHKKLQRFIPLWTFDGFAYRDLNKYVFRYDEPKDELERSVNAIADTLASHSQLFLQDWVELKLDDVLRWPASDVLDFLFLDHFMDIHRGTLINFSMLGLRHKDPLERLWFMEALEATGHAFFENTRAVAVRAEQEQGMRLDYFADRHATVNPKETEKIINFKALNIADSNKLDNIHGLIDTVFDSLEKLLTMSLEAACNNKFSVR